MCAALRYNPALYLPISIAECMLISEGVYLETEAWAVCIPDRRLKKNEGDLFVEVCHTALAHFSATVLNTHLTGNLALSVFHNPPGTMAWLQCQRE